MAISKLMVTHGYLKDFCINPEKYKAFQTGSRVFSVASEISDYDYFIRESDWLSINPEITNLYSMPDANYIEEFEFKSIHLVYEGKDINVIRCSDFEFRVWRYATDMMKLLSAVKTFRDIIKDKAIRVSFFELFKKTFRKEKGASFENTIGLLCRA